MPRKDIFEILNEKYNLNNEMKKIVTLFMQPMFAYTNPMNFQQSQLLNIEGIVDNFVLHDWKQRHGCLNCAEIRKKLKIGKLPDPQGDLILTLEYFINLIRLAQNKVGLGQNINFQYPKEYIMLLQNLQLILERLNYEECTIQEEEKILLIPKDPAATAVAEISSNETAMAILKYHHASLKGQLEEKRKLLLTIATEYEPLLNKGIDDFSSYFTTVRGMINNAHIRHNNKEGKDRNETIAKMSDDELEKLYDEIYQLLLFCVLAKDNKERKNKMADFLKGLKEKK